MWEVRQGGSDSSGGGFVAGASGTDRSQADSAFANGTNLTVDGTTNTDVTPDGYSPVAADVGNLIQITTTGGGAAFTVGFYQIASIQSGKWRLDRSPAATSSAGATWAMGGALLTLSKLASGFATGNKAWIRSGTYTQTAGVTFSTTGANVNTGMPNRLIGYYQTRGDIGQTAAGTFTNNANRPLVQLSTNTGLTAITLSNGGWLVENLRIDGASLGTSRAILFSGARSTLRNCKLSNCSGSTGGSVTFSSSESLMISCEVTGQGAGTRCVVFSGTGQAICNWIHDCSNEGIRFSGNNGLAAFNLITNITPTSSGSGSGIITGAFTLDAKNNSIYNCSANGIEGFFTGSVIRNNLLVNCGGYGLKGSFSGLPATPDWDGNAYYSNTSGNRNQLDDTGSGFAVNASSPYTNALDVILTADPFTNAAGGDFTLNSTAGGGAACRGTATPGAIPGVSQVGYLDFGCFQAQASSGGIRSQRHWSGGLT